MARDYKNRKSILEGSGILKGTEEQVSEALSEKIEETTVGEVLNHIQSITAPQGSMPAYKSSMASAVGTFSGIGTGGTQVVQTRIPFDLKDELEMMARRMKRAGDPTASIGKLAALAIQEFIRNHKGEI